ncbi:MAG: hypothetical protein IKG19_04960, partial [Lachnospiraceae bacterium]|nr:hypothetical protein [Lachnospiraceae bacterium]
LVMSLVLLARWEITLHMHPEWFSDRTNANAQCRNCKEKLCAHKTQLKTMWKEAEAYTEKRIRRLRK